MTVGNYLKQLNNKNARAGNKTFDIVVTTKKEFDALLWYIIFTLGMSYAIVKTYPQEYKLTFKTQKMLKY
jgi:hypothetical protein